MKSAPYTHPFLARKWVWVNSQGGNCTGYWYHRPFSFLLFACSMNGKPDNALEHQPSLRHWHTLAYLPIKLSHHPSSGPFLDPRSSLRSPHGLWPFLQPAVKRVIMTPSSQMSATLVPSHPGSLAQSLVLNKCSSWPQGTPPCSTLAPATLPALLLGSRSPWQSEAQPLSPDSMRPLREASVARVQEISIRFSCSCSWLSESWGTSTKSPSPTGTTFCMLKRHRHTDMEGAGWSSWLGGPAG